jgi:hypothetical protein
MKKMHTFMHFFTLSSFLLGVKVLSCKMAEMQSARVVGYEKKMPFG